jgi:heparanase 1
LPNITDTFMSSFWYADALGGLARLGLAQFGRQALVGGNYGLLQEHTYEPNPDLYAAVAWKRLMGPEVLNATFSIDITGDGSSDVDATQLHVYAHCEAAGHWEERRGQQRGREGEGGRAVTLLFINVSPETEYALSVPQAWQNDGRERREWHFTATDVYSHEVLLNGAPLVAAPTGALPALPPTMAAAGGPVVAQPLSYGFAVLEGVACPAGV